MELKKTKNIHIACYESDEACCLKPASFLNYAQEIAGDSADELGFGADVFKPMNQAWIIARMKVEFEKYPHWGEDISLTTWHRGLESLYFLRDFVLKDAKGETLIKATSSWVIFDLSTRRIALSDIPQKDGSICRETVFDNPTGKEASCGKLRAPRGLELKHCGEHKVAYSDIDKNHHTNNVQYTVWAMDCFEEDFLIQNPLKSLEINFNQEARKGDTVELLWGSEDGRTWFVEGKVGEIQSFILKLVF